MVFTSLPFEVLLDSDESLIFQSGLGPLGTKADEATLNRYVQRCYDPINRIVTVPRGLFSWQHEGMDQAATKVLSSIGQLEPGMRLVYTQYMRPDLPLNNIMKTMGKVNATTFDPRPNIQSSFAGFPAGTLLCDPPKVKEYRNAVGVVVWDIGFNFTFLPKQDKAGTYRGHNAFLHYLSQNGAAVDYRYVVAGNDKPFRSADFYDLFRPDQ